MLRGRRTHAEIPIRVDRSVMPHTTFRLLLDIFTIAGGLVRIKIPHV